MHRRHFVLLGSLAVLAPTASLPAIARGAGPQPGIEVLLREHLAELRGRRIGLVTNLTGVDRDLRSDIDLLAAHKDLELVALFGPEHGVRGDAQAGEHVDAARDAATGLPLHSLYGATREPTASMLAGIDLLLFDIQDIGTRYYTYASTLAGVLRAARRQDIPVWVLDRPNPLGGEKVEGPVLEPRFASFVGEFPIPVRHGMTIGELARLFNEAFGIGARLRVIPVRGWRRGDTEPGGAMPWVPPSPNMPDRDTALVYPGTALLEGTNVSEGRGTTRPFTMIGAPFVDAQALAARLNALGLPGVRFRPTWFTPGFSKHAGKSCGGVQLHVTDRGAFQPFRSGLAVVKALHDLYPEQFRFRADLPGASADFFDHLAGNAWLREAIERGDSLEAMAARWQSSLRDFERLRRRYLLYP